MIMYLYSKSVIYFSECMYAFGYKYVCLDLPRLVGHMFNTKH